MARARRALESAGLNPAVPLLRASSVTNEVWLTDEYAVRINRRPDQRLHREATLGPHLPPEVGYPSIVAYGGELGNDWLIVSRRPGVVLSRAWPRLDNDDRRTAIRQLAEKLKALHVTECPPTLPAIDAPQLLDAHRRPCVAPLLKAIGEADALPFVDRGMLEDLATFVGENAGAVEPFTASTLIHGDLTFENLLWDPDRRELSAILDFEWARAAPPDLDLDVLLRFCAYPYLHVAEDYESVTRAEDYAPVPWWLSEDYPDLFDVPDQLERVKLYSIAYDVRELLLFPPRGPIRDLSEHHPHNRLRRTIRGTSHLDRLAVEPL
jgi:aminoglycoside phosphotransferase (APT) family kinase protein